MATIGLISELEVVNSVLSVAGDNPVQTLDDSYQPVFIIREMINNVSREMQNRGYWFNTEYDVELEPNKDTSKIILPYNILKFEPVDSRYIARGNTVYDRVERSTSITKAICVDISVQLKFEELPQSAREYIRAKCRIQYNNEYFGETVFKRDLEMELQKAEMLLNKEDIENDNINIFKAARVQNIAFRNRRGN